MFHANLLLLILPLITAARFDFSIIYRIEADPRRHQFIAGSQISEDLEKATEISLNQKVPIILRSFDLSFAKNLNTLSMDNSGINEIEVGSLKNLETLKFLNITNNPLKVIKEGIFNYMNVEVLNLAHNKLATISPGAFDHMERLNYIILDYNEFTSYALWFKDCPNLVSISAQYNFVQYLPPNIFDNLIKHKLIVQFSYNKINMVHQDLFDVEEFDELAIDHNELTIFDGKISKVGILKLQYNRINCLPEAYVKNEFRKVRKVYLEDNPINCTCHGYLKQLSNVVVSNCVEDNDKD